MKRKFKLYEDKDTYKFTVILSPKINKDMDVIYDINQNKTKELRKWYTYIDEVKEYVSKREIAWNYNKRNIKFPNGTYFIKDFDYNVGYTIKSDKTTHNPFVYIFMINLKPEEFGLKVPQTNESRRRRFALHLNESKIIPNKFTTLRFGHYFSSDYEFNGKRGFYYLKSLDINIYGCRFLTKHEEFYHPMLSFHRPFKVIN